MGDELLFDMSAGVNTHEVNTHETHSRETDIDIEQLPLLRPGSSRPPVIFRPVLSLEEPDINLDKGIESMKTFSSRGRFTLHCVPICALFVLLTAKCVLSLLPAVESDALVRVSTTRLKVGNRWGDSGPLLEATRGYSGR